MKQNINNNGTKKQRFNIIVAESERVLGGYMVTTEPMTHKQLEKWMVKTAREYVKNNSVLGDPAYELRAETDDEAETLILSVTARRVSYTRAILIDIYDYEAEGFTMFWSKPSAPKAYTNEEAAANADRIEAERNAAERPAEEVEQVDECTTVRRHTTAARIMQTAQVIAEAVGAFTGSTYPAHDIKTDCTRFAKWIEGEECETINPAAPFWFAVRKQGAESGTREYVKKRCAGLGAPVYILKVERETLPGLFTLTVRVSSPATAAQIFEAATANNEPAEGGATAEPTNTNPEHTEPATEPESEPQSEPKAPTLAEIAADYAAGTADSIRRRWHAFAAKATTAARAAGCYIGMALIFAVTAAAFILSAWFVPDMVESWPDLPRVFGVVVGVFGFTMGVEYLTIKVCDAIDAKTGFFGFNPLAYRR